MKTAIKLFGIIATVAIIAFSIIACDDDIIGGPNPFIGTWVGSHDIFGGGTIILAISTDSTWTMTYTYGSNDTDYLSGTYTCNGNSATFLCRSGDFVDSVGTGVVSGNTLSLTASYYEQLYTARLTKS